ncbi:MAG TPA: hypothetical protein VEJ20_03390 [Candidatus Eremiobacteraceae bacterium]|nr:hypothetical protein [Candidatus Eremiobacteraceae bacterium]
MKNIASLALASLFASFAVAHGQAAQADSYPTTMAPIAKYLMPSAAAEVALARSAAPPSVSADAQILVLTASGYAVAAQGGNGWVCFVGRSWTAGLDDPEFWNSRGLGPACLNPPAVRSVLPQYLARTRWAIAGDTREEIAAKSKAAYADHEFTDPAPGSFALMLSKQGYLLGADGPWHPHVMPFIAYDQINEWAAGFKGSPIFGPSSVSYYRPYEPLTIAIPVSHWSDGSLSPPVS